MRLMIMIGPRDDLKFHPVAEEGLLSPPSRFKRAVGDKSKKTNFMTKPYVFCVLSVLITHVSSSIKRGPIREEVKLPWEHPPERPCAVSSGWESIWAKLAAVWVWASEQEVI